MKGKPLVSVIIPTYQRSKYLEGAIQTAINQDYSNIEVIIVNDDTSDERTVNIIDTFAKQHNIIGIHNETRQGLSQSRNQAAALANGKYICILDDDDRWEKTKVRKQVALFEKLGTEFASIYTGGRKIKAGKVIQRYTPSESRRGSVWPDILVRWGMSPHASHMIRLSAFEAVGGFDTGLSHGEDWELSIRLAKQYKFEAIDEDLTIRHIHGDNVSNSINHINQRRSIFSRHSKSIAAHENIFNEFFSLWHQRLGRWAMEDGHWREGLKHEMLSAIYAPTPERILRTAVAFGGPHSYILAQKVKNKFNSNC